MPFKKGHKPFNKKEIAPKFAPQYFDVPIPQVIVPPVVPVEEKVVLHPMLRDFLSLWSEYRQTNGSPTLINFLNWCKDHKNI